MRAKYQMPNSCWSSVSGLVGCSVLYFVFTFVSAAFATTTNVTNDNNASPTPVTALEFYNSATELMRETNWNEAELQFQSSIAKQDERIQPAALFNLGHVRFAQGVEELKKSPFGSVQRSRNATDAAGSAIQKATDALASNDMQTMVEAYFTGRGVQKKLRAASDAIKRALEAHGKTLLKWKRALGDFQDAAEMNPADTNAVHNAEVVAQAIAKLVDTIQQMQQSAAGLNGKKSELGELLKQLKGKIPAPNSPPGAPGEDGEEDDNGKNGKQPKPESLTGLKENEGTGGGQEMELKLSPEKAGELLNGLVPDGKPLPIGQGEAGKPKNRSGRIW
jgi:TolA-binding protein